MMSWKMGCWSPIKNKKRHLATQWDKGNKFCYTASKLFLYCSSILGKRAMMYCTPHPPVMAIHRHISLQFGTWLFGTRRAKLSHLRHHGDPPGLRESPTGPVGARRAPGKGRTALAIWGWGDFSNCAEMEISGEGGDCSQSSQSGH